MIIDFITTNQSQKEKMFFLSLLLLHFFLLIVCADNNQNYNSEECLLTTRAQIWEWNGCDEIYYNNHSNNDNDAHDHRPIHNASTWMLLRGLYRGIVQEESSIQGNHLSGYRVPFVVQQSPDKGRGVYATAPVPAGTLVYTTTGAGAQSARFRQGQDYRTFLNLLPSDLTCDVMQWAYVQAFSSVVTGRRRKTAFICVDLDEGSFMNEAIKGQGSNVGCPDSAKNCDENFYALRDISAGEEFLCKYSDFAISDGWEWFGL